jgi:hypothetical protein
VKLTRRELLAGAAAGALGAAGVYELVDRLGTTPARPAARGRMREQHLLEGTRIVEDSGVEVLVPPLHHQVVTAKVAVGESPADLRAAQAELEQALNRLDGRFEPTPAGLGVTVAWGRPYFHRYVSGPARRHLPVDRRAGAAKRRQVSALLDAIRFPSDPDDVVLEDNDVAVLLRSDSSAHVAAGAKALFDDLDVFRVTSIRKGFAGGGFDGGQSLPKRMAMAAGVSGADLIPDTAELFLGFTSTQRAGMGPERIANLETLGYADLGRSDYFRGGTTVHVSHVFEDLEFWYLNFSFRERVDTAFRPGLKVAEDAQTVRQVDAASVTDVEREFAKTSSIGHSAGIQTASRLQRDVVGADGTRYPKGTAVPQRADFNTLDNPFFWSATPERDRMDAQAAAGVHFVVFHPTSDDFHRTRLAMDGVLPNGRKLPLVPRDRAQGINAVLRTTHRQNFLVPPREHRSFPLAELL